MKAPKGHAAKVKINGVYYKVEYKERARDVPDETVQVESAWGFVDVTRRLIRVVWHPENPDQTKRNLWHEILHILTMDMNISSLQQKNGDDDTAHRDLDTLAMGIATVLKENKL